ncbi:MAG: DUF721 domain-containing protein [Candidatus Eremiobacteraeota bacterium]|nr:DUF721 domain-containing protein [Candidatus Eremiobacteraeota bacterium]MCW5869051.1 DUF721 domain-containing protein [Candidatus Eremiobacteraeota bacterium]
MLRPLGLSLAPAVEDLGITQKLARFQIQACWPELVGARLAPHCTPQKLQGRILWLRVRAPVWAQEIMLAQDSILTSLARRFPRLRVEQLRCQVGVVVPILGEGPAPASDELSAIELPRSVEYRLERLAAGVEDPDLRASFLRALRQKERRDVWLRSQGAMPCQLCGALQERRLCLGCRQQRGRERRQKLFQLIGRQPWVSYAEAQMHLPALRQSEFHTARRQLLSLHLLNYYQQRDVLETGVLLPPALRHLMLQICMLSTQIPWDQLQDRHIYFSLGKTWGTAYLEDKAPPPFDKTRRKKKDPEAAARAHIRPDDAPSV